MADYSAMAAAFEAEGGDLLKQWDERVAEIGVTASSDPAVGLTVTDLPALLMKLMPLVTMLLTTGFTPAALLTLLPDVVKVLFPQLDATLVELLQKIIAFFLNRS